MEKFFSKIWWPYLFIIGQLYIVGLVGLVCGINVFWLPWYSLGVVMLLGLLLVTLQFLDLFRSAYKLEGLAVVMYLIAIFSVLSVVSFCLAPSGGIAGNFEHLLALLIPSAIWWGGALFWLPEMQNRQTKNLKLTI